MAPLYSTLKAYFDALNQTSHSPVDTKLNSQQQAFDAAQNIEFAADPPQGENTRTILGGPTVDTDHQLALKTLCETVETTVNTALKTAGISKLEYEVMYLKMQEVTMVLWDARKEVNDQLCAISLAELRECVLERRELRKQGHRL